MKTRLALAVLVAAGSFAVAGPASATDCSNPKEPCTGACQINRNFGTGDLRPIVCYA